MKNYKYIYGPVSSWRLSRSLGIDPISSPEKTCSFSCIYCQVGDTETLSVERKVFVPTQEIINEIQSLPLVKIDYITFSGRGEPTLAKNLGEIISEIKKVREEKIAVITNCSLIDREDVRADLARADLVMVKLDADGPELLEKINQPHPEIKFGSILNGIKKFRQEYKGCLALQIMFVEKNKNLAPELAKLAREINPDLVQINTPLRPSPEKSLPKEGLDQIKEYFTAFNCVYVYDASPTPVQSLSSEDTLKRRGKEENPQ